MVVGKCFAPAVDVNSDSAAAQSTSANVLHTKMTATLTILQKKEFLKKNDSKIVIICNV